MFCLILSIGTYSSVSSFCPNLCICFYVLGKSATFHSHGEVALHRCPVRQSNLTIRVRYSRGVTYVGFMCLPFMMELRLLLWCTGRWELACMMTAAVHWSVRGAPSTTMWHSHIGCGMLVCGTIAQPMRRLSQGAWVSRALSGLAHWP